MSHRIGLAVVALGVVAIGLGAIVSLPLDLAIAIVPGWHVTVFAPAVVAGVLLLIAGAAVLAVAAFRGRR